jgi:hypothetical protein
MATVYWPVQFVSTIYHKTYVLCNIYLEIYELSINLLALASNEVETWHGTLISKVL